MHNEPAAVKFLDLDPIARVQGTVKMPGSKSISNRVLLLAALSEGETRVESLLDSDDTRVMLEALARLGVRIERQSDDSAVVHGVGGSFPVKSAELRLGNAGTAFRPLAAALALTGGEYRLSGAPRMHERPIGDLVDALRRLGARIEYSGAEGFPPLVVRAGRIRAGDKVRVRGDVSSQYLSALLMALPMTGARIEVEGELISKPYVEITLNLMRRFGVVFPCGRRDRRRPGARRGRGAGQHPGRRALHGSARAHGRADLDGRGLDRGLGRPRQAECHRRGPQPYSRRGDDRRGDGALR